MSDNIYDIIGKLNGLGPKDNPISTSAEPVYESIDLDDITPAVNNLEEKYQNFLTEEAKKSQSQKDAELTRGEPEVVKLLHKARLERPTAASDMEAFAYQMVKANKELEKATAANDEQEQKIADLDAKVTALSTAKPTPVATPAPAPAPTQPVQPTAATPVAPTARPSATILRMPTPTAQPAPAEVPTTQQPTQVAQPAAAKPARTYKPAVKKPTVGGEVQPTVSAPDQPDEFTAARLRKQAKQLAPNVSTIAPIGVAVGQQFAPQKKENKLMKDMLKESIELLREYKEGDPQLGIYNFNDMLAKFNSGAYRVTLDFGGKPLTLYDYQAYGLLAYLGSEQNQERKVANIEAIMSSHDAVVNALMSPKVKKYILMFPAYEEMSDVHKKRTKEIEKGKFQLSAPDPKKGFTDPRYNPKTDPTSPEYDPTYPVQSHPYQQSDSQLEENLGTKSMKNLEQIAESLMERFANFKEEAKPDFLDLDKDGDTEEPMKQAAKDAKDAEPAKPDSDAVAKRKRLQALKDKQEDERAEKDDYDSKSSVRTIKGRAYGGAAQKDDEDKDLDEAGYSAKAARAGKDIGKPGKAFAKIAKSAGERYGSKERGEKVAGAVLKKLRANEGEGCMDEVAPPGAKAERMVKHIKKGYAKDGKLTKREKGIAYATAWKAHNKGQVEEGVEFGDTIKNSEAKMTKVKVTEGKEAIRNHPIYTNEEAWNHYKQELDEQEAMETSMMETPVVDVQEELNEIARLAGLAPKMEAKCSSCGCADCKCTTLEEAMSRKHYRAMADEIRNMENREDAERLARKYSAIAKQDNSRFKEEMFLAACGIDVDECGMTPATVLVGEESVDEGNEFTKARLDAIAAGKDSFSVGGKTYKVSGDTSTEKTQVESVDDEKQAVTEDININVSANGEEDVVNLIRKLSGMPVVAIQASPVAEEQATCEACGMIPCGCEQEVDEDRDIELANTPHETVAPLSAVTTDAGGGLGGVKKQYPLAANRGANPIEESTEEKLWTAYESMINDLKA